MGIGFENAKRNYDRENLSTSDYIALYFGELFSYNKARLSNYVDGTGANPEVLYLNIDTAEYRQLLDKRAEAIEKGGLVTSKGDYVPAYIVYNGDTVKIKVRLKGDALDHLLGDKWSFRVKAKGQNTVMGMKRFSLMHPGRREFVDAWICHQLMRQEGLIGLRYKFLKLHVNGKDKGIYAVEEHFDKRLLENNERREGPIIKFTEDLMWERNAYSVQSAEANEPYMTSGIEAFQLSGTLKDPGRKEQFLTALSLLESFRRGEAKTHEVFDVAQLAKFMALTDLMEALHANSWHNQRFYYNPISAVLEPIGFDYFGETKFSHSLLIHLKGAYINEFQFRAFFNDTLFLKNYVREIQRISKPKFLDDFFEGISEELSENLSIIHSEFPQYIFSTELFYKKQTYINNILNPAQAIQAYVFETRGDQMVVNIGNIQTMPIEILGVKYKYLKAKQQVDTTFTLAAKLEPQPIQFNTFFFTFPDSTNLDEVLSKSVYLVYRILGTDSIRRTKVNPWPFESKTHLEGNVLMKTSNIDDFDFLQVDHIWKNILIKPGNHNLSSTLVIPSGYVVHAEGDIVLTLKNGANIISRSPLNIIGTEEKKITIQSESGKGQGILVYDVDDHSNFQHVIFKNLSAPSTVGWALSGALTFYNTKVSFSNCQFDGSTAEDMLNIVKSEYTIDNCSFMNTRSDAFDSDFSEGWVANSLFAKCGNDAIDLMSSKCKISNISFKEIGDKGVAAGEKSDLTAKYLVFNEVNIAIAGKDQSALTLNDIAISNTKIGIAAFQKKPEYGPANIQITELSFVGTDTPYLIEIGSVLTVDGKSIDAEIEDVKGLLYPK